MYVRVTHGRYNRADEADIVASGPEVLFPTRGAPASARRDGGIDRGVAGWSR